MVKKCKDCDLEADPQDKICKKCGGELIESSSDKDPTLSNLHPRPVYPRVGDTMVYCTNCKQVVSLKKSVDWYVVLFLAICCCCSLFLYLFYYAAIKEPDTCPICGEKLEYVNKVPLNSSYE